MGVTAATARAFAPGVLAILGVLASWPAPAHAATPSPVAPGTVSVGVPGGSPAIAADGGDDGNGGGTVGVGSGNAANTSGGSPIQQTSLVVNGTHTYQSANCNQPVGLCNLQQRGVGRAWP